MGECSISSFFYVVKSTVVVATSSFSHMTTPFPNSPAKLSWEESSLEWLPLASSFSLIPPTVATKATQQGERRFYVGCSQQPWIFTSPETEDKRRCPSHRSELPIKNKPL
ncbi:hypothetical protein SUGI_0568980 [Cryptomeria japonica]|nr:hypothetical protein SUGI_0568980 [Cryptomeria japonica]